MTFISPETQMRLESEWLEMQRAIQILPLANLKNLSRSTEQRPVPDVGKTVAAELSGDPSKGGDTPGKSRV